MELWDAAFTRLHNMKLLLLVLLVVLTGCAETRIYEHGQLVAVIQGDATNLNLSTGNGFSLHADSLIHSTPTSAAYTGATKVIGGVASGVTSAAAVIK